MKTILGLTLAAVFITGIVVWSRRLARPVVVIPAPTRAVTHQTNTIETASAGSAGSPEAYSSPWAALRTGDQAAFVRLLRQSGCPEETVRLFALAAVGRQIQERLDLPERARVQTSVYWREEWERERPQWPVEMQRQRSVLEGTLSRLLQIQGDQFRQEFVEFDPGPDWLPGDVRTKLNPVLVRQRAEIEEIENQGAPGVIGPIVDATLRAKLQAARRQHRTELEQLLGPDSLASYEVRESMEADYVRQHLPPARNEEEFGRLVAAARDVGFTESEMLTDLLLPSGVQEERPMLRQRILARFSELNDPERAEEFQEAADAQDRSAAAAREIENGQRRLRDLQSLARGGGVDLSDDEARSLESALERRGKELDREWGDPGTISDGGREALKQRVREEMEKAATATLGDKGRAIIEQMWKRDKPNK